MKDQRVKVALYFIGIVVFLPGCIIVFREVARALLEAWMWDDSMCSWIDTTFKLPVHVSPKDAHTFFERAFGGGSHRWLIDILTLPLVVWCLRFLTGAIEEVHYTHDITPLEAVEIIGRWATLSAVTMLSLPVLTALFHRILREFELWEPLALVVLTGLALFLCLYCWQYSYRRLKHVEKVHSFERLKRRS
ncbi:MAG: hypothetical protein F6J97_26900 [Leptolyngbya sp. SIO4C1]|nr:hypothetical protein [Leptolyngbya sp. SIO4C1]